MGNQQWIKDFATASESFSEAYSVQQTTDGGYIFTGYGSSGLGTYKDAYLIKTDINGNTEWAKIFSINGEQRGHSVQQTLDGGYIVAGFSDDFEGDDQDVFLVKTNSQGDIVWTRTFGDIDDDQAYSVQQTNDGGYIVTGYKGDDINGSVYLIKTDVNGNTNWARF